MSAPTANVNGNMQPASEPPSDAERALIEELEHKYMWWQPAGGSHHAEDRIIAQAMNLGTYDDIRRMERTLGCLRLYEVMLRAQPGWLDDRSWEFSRGRLSHRLGKPVPDEGPRRSFLPNILEPRFDVLADTQKLIWPRLAAAPRLSLVLYGGTAVALQLATANRMITIFFEPSLSIRNSSARNSRSWTR